jgi:hypothetical protein
MGDDIRSAFAKAGGDPQGALLEVLMLFLRHQRDSNTAIAALSQAIQTQRDDKRLSKIESLVEECRERLTRLEQEIRGLVVILEPGLRPALAELAVEPEKILRDALHRPGEGVRPAPAMNPQKATEGTTWGPGARPS